MNQSLFVHSDLDDMTNLTPNALRVYMHLTRRADKSGRAWPSYQSMGDHCFLSVSDNPVTRRSMARKAIDELMAAGLVAKENRMNDTGYTSNVYVLVSPVPIDTGMSITTAMPQNNDPMSIGIAMPQKPEPMPIDTAMPNGTKDTPSEDTPLEETEREEEQTHAREPLAVAWRQAYAGIEMPPKLAKSLQELVAECGMAAAIHGIKASAAKEDGRNFRYIAECARNYVPPPPKASYANGNAYSIDIPGVTVLPAVEQPVPPPKLPPPLAHDDPWAIVLADIAPTLTRQSAEWLKDSRCVAAGELAGVPLYKVTVSSDANVGWLKQQAEPLIRKTLSSVLRKRLLIEIVAESEPVHA